MTTVPPQLDLVVLREQAELHEPYSRHRNMELPSSTVLALIALAEKWEDNAGETAAKMIDATARAEAAEATVTRVRDRRDNWADMLKHAPGPHEGTPLEFVSIAVDSLARALDGSS